MRKKTKPARKVQELKLAFSEFYLGLILLQNYQTLNFTGFRKILKKHDKLLNVDLGAKWRTDHVEMAHFYVNKDIDRIIHDTESIVTQDIEGGDRQKAMKRLRVVNLSTLYIAGVYVLIRSNFIQKKKKSAPTKRATKPLDHI